MPAPARSRQAEAVFLNVPFDRGYEQLLVALVAGLTMLGLRPCSVLDVPPHTDRLTRLKAIIRGCRYSIHDLSRRVSRFNMPFELGLVLGLHDAAPPPHTWVVLDSHRAHALDACLSDIAGYDVVHSHAGSPTKLLSRLHQLFYRRDITLSDLKLARRRLQRFASTRLRRTLLTRHGFKELTVAALKQAEVMRTR